MTVIKDASSLLQLAKELSAWLQGEKQDGLRLDCMNELGVYTTTVNVDGKLAKWVRRIGPRTRGFSAGQVYDVRIYGLKPAPVRLESAVTREPNRIVADLTQALDYDMFRMEVFFYMDSEWLKGLVHHRSSPEPLKEATKYHLSAQLTDPSALNLGFAEVDVEDYPVTARVQIQEDIDTAMPTLKLVRRIRQIEEQILSDYDPRHATKMIALQRERSALKGRILRENPAELLRELLLILRPTKFVSYLHTEEDFRLQGCEWGSDLFEMMGSIALPKAIEATARADLDIGNPTAKGYLFYQSGQFSHDIGAILEKLKKPQGK